jgi:cytochrome c
MKNMFTGVIVLIAIFCNCSKCYSEEMATPMEVMDKVKLAIKLINDEGEEAALPKIRDKKGPFVWKDSYVYVLHMDGMMVAHPYQPELEGVNQIGLKDVKDKAFFVEMYDLAKENDSGWIDYLWVKPNRLSPSLKVAFFAKVPGKNIICLAGIYDLRKEDVLKMLKQMGKS